MAGSGSEVILISDSSAQKWSVAAYDLHTGSFLRSFKGQAVAAGCLCVQANHTLFGVASGKPILQLWPLSRKDEMLQRIVCPGKVSSLCLSPNGLFCVASIQEQLYIWELSSGGLLQVLDGFDEVTVIRFTDDGSHIVTGSSSGSLAVWDFALIVSIRTKKQDALKPRYKIHAHGEPITDIHVGCGGPVARITTCSSDHTCKMWDMTSGKIMKTLAFDVSVCSVIMDQQELVLFAGLQSGDIWCIPLYSQISQPEEFISRGGSKAGHKLLQGHSGAVCCMALSGNGLRLASGSHSKTGNPQVKVWNLESGDSLAIDPAGPVTNILVLPAHVLSSAAPRQGPIITFQHHHTKLQGAKGRVVNVTIADSSQIEPRSKNFTKEIASLLCPDTATGGKEKPAEVDTSAELEALRQENARLKELSKHLLEQSC